MSRPYIVKPTLLTKKMIEHLLERQQDCDDDTGDPIKLEDEIDIRLKEAIQTW